MAGPANPFYILREPFWNKIGRPVYHCPTIQTKLPILKLNHQWIFFSALGIGFFGADAIIILLLFPGSGRCAYCNIYTGSIYAIPIGNQINLFFVAILIAWALEVTCSL
jgi:hypothetical protein